MQIVFAAPPDLNDNVEYGLIEQHKCQIDYIAELSKAKGLENFWNECQSGFQQNIYEWMACTEISTIARFGYVQHDDIC